MVDVVVETVRCLYVGGLFIFLIVAGRRKGLKRQSGWSLILCGFGLLLFGMVIDITDNFPQLNKYIVIGDTPFESFLEKVVGHMLGFFLLAIGFWRLIPAIVGLQETQTRLQASHRELRREIRERQQAEVELKKTRDEAEAANEAKSRFLAQMSHEIRTPLNGVLGMSELLQETGLNLHQRRLAQTIRNSGEVLLHIINEILDFSKIEAGRLELEHIDFNLSRTVEETINLMAERAQAKNLELTCLLAPELPLTVRGDPRRLHQILFNLVGNAIKFTDAGQIILSVRPLEVSENKLRVHFSVKDTGIGIPPALQNHIFQPFSQGDSSTTRKYGGTGLGLTIARHLVECMHGELGVMSEPGQGSTFWFTIELEQPSAACEPRVSPRLYFQKVRLVVAEPNESHCKNLRCQFASLGLKPDWVASGRHLLEMLRIAALRGKPYDLAMIAGSLPDTSALQLAKTIKADFTLAEARLVLLTSFTDLPDLPPGAENGFAACLGKPVTSSELSRCLTALLTGEAGKTPVAEQTQAATRVARGPYRVLVAEDNLVNQEVTRGMLESLGCRVEVAGTGREAVEALAGASRYDVVFMDCQMPEMDGYEATRLIREAEANRQPPERSGAGVAHLPIIALTAHALEGDRKKCLDAGMDDYLSKPFSLEQLTAVLDRWLSPGPEASPALFG
jgi:signal transduction histidine kinase/DNA-binding response OmpR family regulator